ncbi:MAG TPA: stalk domain-containing protein [Acetivibrio sp.]|uniref:stalk domain-containing protein n=1 Tax=Acetivibrio sp. TaxID=1872092 RepID=UPI002CD4D30A|nr:stalk domain-containing protein [Acetivibrio sp.]HOM01660.1 stalk domain-containing protein [Acetivibrio sp.]
MPLRFISENMGYKVTWDDKSKIVFIVEESAKEKYVLNLFDHMLYEDEKDAENEKKIIDVLKDEDWSWKRFYEIEGGLSIERFEDDIYEFRKDSRDLMEWLVNDCKSIDVQSKIRIMAESDLEVDGAAAELYYEYIVNLFEKYPLDFIKVLAGSNKVREEVYEVAACGGMLELNDELADERLETLKGLYNNDLSEKERDVVDKLIDILSANSTGNNSTH